MIWVIGGTKDSRDFLEKFIKYDSDIIVSTATEYGAKLIENLPVKTSSEKMDKEAMLKFVDDNKITKVIDISHPYAFEVSKNAMEVAEEKNIKIKAGNVLTSDEFYNDNSDYYKKWSDFGVLAVEMETAGLYTLAAKYKAKALSILTISDSLVSPEITSAEEREKTFSEMIELALEIATRM